MSFIKVVDSIVTQEINPKVQKEDDKEASGELLSEIEQSKYDVLYGDSLQRPTGKR